MRASKEQCRRVMAKLESMRELLYQNNRGVDYEVARQFLEAAERKLPTEAAYDKEANKSDVEKAAKKGFGTIHTDKEKYPKSK